MKYFTTCWRAISMGRCTPLTPRAEVVQSVFAYSRGRMAIPWRRVDLAVIAVPADQVLDVARQCAFKGVRALVVLSSGL